MSGVYVGLMVGIATGALCVAVVLSGNPRRLAGEPCDCAVCSARRNGSLPALVKRGAALELRRALLRYDAAEREEREERESVERARAIVASVDASESEGA